jgi:hypothetical protein
MRDGGRRMAAGGSCDERFFRVASSQALNKSAIQDFKGVNEAQMRQVFQQRMRDLWQALNCPPRVCDVEVKDGAMVQGSARE